VLAEIAGGVDAAWMGRRVSIERPIQRGTMADGKVAGVIVGPMDGPENGAGGAGAEKLRGSPRGNRRAAPVWMHILRLGAWAFDNGGSGHSIQHGGPKRHPTRTSFSRGNKAFCSALFKAVCLARTRQARRRCDGEGTEMTQH